MGLHFKNGDVAYLTAYLGGDERIRTAGAAFAEPCLTTWRRRLEGERETGIEPATFSLARRCSTTEPLPHYTCICMIKISYWKGFVNWFLKKITLPRSLDPSIILLHAPGHGMVPAPGGLAGLPRYPAGAAILHRPGGLVTPRSGDRGEEPALPGCLVAHHSLHPTI